MKAIWILEDIKNEEKFFLHELELICLIASVCNWKSMYPDCPTYLYCCPSVYNYLNDLNLLNIWDSINTEELSKEDKVNRRAFWAASKLKCIKNIEAPFVIIDCDLYFKQKKFELQDLEKFDIVVNQIEEGVNVYPSIKDRILSGIVNKHPVKFGWKTTHSPNVSFLYIREDALRKEYTETAWDWMEYLSEKFWNDPGLNGKYMIFCEQKLLKEVADLRNKKICSLINEFLNNEDQTRFNLPEEYLTIGINEGHDYFHLHAKKRYARTDQSLFLDIRSDIIGSILHFNSFDPKLLHQIILKNREIIGPLS